MNNMKLLYRRVQMGYTQLKLAKALREMGEDCTQEEISKYENGHFTPRSQRAEKIALILKCKVEDIF